MTSLPLESAAYGLVRTSVSAGRRTAKRRLMAFIRAFAEATTMSVSAPRPT